MQHLYKREHVVAEFVTVRCRDFLSDEMLSFDCNSRWWGTVETHTQNHRRARLILRAKETLEHRLPLHVSKDIQPVDPSAHAILQAVDHGLARDSKGAINSTGG